jgi:3alpha(or 20beta)-hydroxysteroid dehydrogenase
MRTAIPAMKRNGGGSIINISSTEGLGATPGCAAYTASKFALRGITKVAAIENGKDNIRTNSVHPGSIDTNMMRDLGLTDDHMKALGEKIPGLRRVGLAHEVAGIVVFLASDESSYCNGGEYVVDGGVTASAGYPV